MHKVFSWLKRPYFVNTNLITNLWIDLMLGASVFLFLIVFEPFHISLMDNNKVLFTLGFGGITFLVAYTYTLLFFVVFKNFANEDNYNVAKNILFLSLVLSSISLFNFKYQDFFFRRYELPTRSSFTQSLLKTLSVGTFPILLYTLYTEMYYRKKREKISARIMESRNLSSKKNSDIIEIKIHGNNKDEVLVFNIDRLTYVSSEKNYTSFFLTHDNGLDEKILRLPLHKVMLQLSVYNWIIRCHKSYIINTNSVQKVTGNARGYYLHMNILDFPIPVSRSYSERVLSKVSS